MGKKIKMGNRIRWGKERVKKRKINFWERELKETNMKLRASQGKKI